MFEKNRNYTPKRNDDNMKSGKGGEGLLFAQYLFSISLRRLTQVYGVIYRYMQKSRDVYVYMLVNIAWSWNASLINLKKKIVSYFLLHYQ